MYIVCVYVSVCVYEKCGHERMDLWKEMSALYYPTVLEQYSLCAGLAACLCVSCEDMRLIGYSKE